jgi:energy-coupling factor transporter transmembrane protein EcfT
MTNFDKQDAYKNLERVNFWISNSDTKTSFLLAFIGIIAGLSFSNSKFIEAIIIAINELIIFFGSISIDLRALISFFLIVGIVLLIFFLILTLINLISVITARIDPSEFGKKDVIGNSKLFWGTIAINEGDYENIPENKFPDFLNSVNNMTDQELFEDINSQTYINSMICKKKFTYYNKGIKWLKISAITAIVILPLFLILSSM